MENILTIKAGDIILYKDETHRTYIVSFIEENKFCKGDYGVATEDGYYFSISDIKGISI